MKMKNRIMVLITGIVVLVFGVADINGADVAGKRIHRFSLGDWECVVINDGSRTAPASKFFNEENVKKIMPVLKRKGLDASSIRSSFNILILKKNDVIIIVDTGLGRDMGAGSGRLMANLKRAGIDRAKVNFVVLTHGHWDHIGGITDSKGRLNFPNARYFMSRNEWEYWTSEANVSKLTKERAEAARKNLTPIKDRVTLLKGNEEFIEGITAIPVFGHTPGQITLLIRSKNQCLLHIADVMHFTFQVDVPDACPVYDRDPVRAIESRKKIIGLARKNNCMLFGFHFDFPGLLKVR